MIKFKLKQIFKMLSQHVFFPFIYFVNRWRAVDKSLVIIADAHHDKCPPYMLELRDALKRENLQVVEYFFDLSRKSALGGFLDMARFMKLYAGAGCVVICDNFLPVASCCKKKKTKVIQLWHGCGAFKRFGYDAEDDVPAGYRGNVYKNYDVVTVSGKECVPYFESAMRLKAVRPLGVSHTDRLFDNDYISACRDKLRYEYPDATGKKLVLWAPTFRGNAGNPELIGEAYIDTLCDTEELNRDVYVIKSIHPHMKQIAHKSQYADYAHGMTTDELICCADVLITDYSSVFFEYLLMDKPIIFFAPDYRRYAENRGFYLEYMALPGSVITGDMMKSDDDKIDKFLIERLREELKSAIYDRADAKRLCREQYREAYMSACDGEVTGRIIEIIEDTVG